MLNTDFKFVMVGGHSDKNYVQQLLANQPQNLVTTGQLSFDESLRYFESATLLVNTSISEGFSNTYIQAWLRGIPTIVFGADTDSIIETNQVGCNITQVDEAVKNIGDLFKNQNKYKELSTNAYNYAIENHSIKKMTDNFLKAISSK
jgi:glycosyltransferase involved in cell wall biosynthesis